MINDMQVPVQIYTDALTQPMIAPVQETLTAKQAYDLGAYFIYKSQLYKTTAAITQGDEIVLSGSGANATTAGTVMDRVDDESVVTADASSLVTYNNVSILTDGKLVIISGRFTANAKGAGQENYFFSVPIPRNGAIVAVADVGNNNLLINQSGKLTANQELGAQSFNIMAAYVR